MAPDLPFQLTMRTGLHEDLISQLNQVCRVRKWMVEVDKGNCFINQPISQSANRKRKRKKRKERKLELQLWL